MNSVTVSKQLRLSRGTALVKACQESGLKVKEWCALNGVTKDTYYYWKRKLKDLCLDQVDIPSFVDISGEFPPQTLAATATPEASASVILPGLRIDVYEGASPAFLQKLMEAAKNA